MKSLMNIPIILSTGSLYNFDVDTIMALAVETGFAGIELMVDWRLETCRLPHLERLMARHHLPILAVHSPFANVLIQGWPVEPVAQIKQSVHLAESLGAQTVVVHPPQRWIRLQSMVITPSRSWKLSLPLPLAGCGSLGKWLLEDLPNFQAKTTVKITVENMPCRPFGPFKLEPFHFTRPKQLGNFQYLTLDTTHVGTRHMDLLNFYRQIKATVAHIHLSNYNGQEHQLLDNGVLPLASFLMELAKSQFNGLISLEMNAFDLRADDERLLRQNLRASLVFCQEALGQKAIRLPNLHPHQPLKTQRNDAINP